MIARNVAISMKPFARGRSLGRSSSGKMPYFDGPKNALWTPIKQRTVNRTARLPVAKPIMPSTTIPNSATLHATMIVRLL